MPFILALNFILNHIKVGVHKIQDVFYVFFSSFVCCSFSEANDLVKSSPHKAISTCVTGEIQCRAALFPPKKPKAQTKIQNHEKKNKTKKPNNKILLLSFLLTGFLAPPGLQ